MKVRLLYFARLREQLGLASEHALLPPEVRTVGELLAWLRTRPGPWAEHLADEHRFRVAVNQDMANANTEIRVNDEIALFPPVTGG